MNRRPIHARNLSCQGYLRDDQLWEFEATLHDSKAHAFNTIERGRLPPETPIHDLTLRVCLDDELYIKEIEATMEAAPFQLCRQVPERLKQLCGIQIGKDWLKKVSLVIRREENCTHLTELLRMIANTAFQTIFPYKVRDADSPKIMNASIINQCQGFSAQGEIIQSYFPEIVQSHTVKKTDNEEGSCQSNENNPKATVKDSK